MQPIIANLIAADHDGDTDSATPASASDHTGGGGTRNFEGILGDLFPHLADEEEQDEADPLIAGDDLDARLTGRNRPARFESGTAPAKRGRPVEDRHFDVNRFRTA
jgi:hypothetical protein